MQDRNKVFAVIDTNVIVSSLFSVDGSSFPALVVGAVLSGIITPLYNDEILDEYRDVLSRPKFPFGKEMTDTIVSAIRDFGLNMVRTPIQDVIIQDADDIVFYEVKMSLDDAYLVTGNTRHFPKEPFVVTPAEMIEVLKKKGLV